MQSSCASPIGFHLVAIEVSARVLAANIAAITKLSRILAMVRMTHLTPMFR
jgi:hypothetical protein